MEKEFLQTETAGANGWTVWSVNGRIDMVTAEKAYATGEDIVNRNERKPQREDGSGHVRHGLPFQRRSPGTAAPEQAGKEKREGVYPVRAFRHCEIRTGRQRYGRFIYDLCFPE